MAFALIIVYAGAILITYMFVLMLAQQASDSDHFDDIPVYDRLACEPGAAVIVGLVLGHIDFRNLLGLDHATSPVVERASSNSMANCSSNCRNGSRRRSSMCGSRVPVAAGD